MTKVLITGGAGFIGFHLARFLANQNQEVTIIDNFFRGKKDEEFRELITKKNVKCIEGNLEEKETFNLLDVDYDYVYHLAAINGTRYFYEIPDKILKNNLLSTINILEWFVTTKCKKILFASSSETYAGTAEITNMPFPTPEEVPLSVVDPHNPRWSYGGSKIMGELLFINYARMHRFDMTIIRYCNTYGPRMGFEHVIPEFILRIIKKEEPFLIKGGKPTRTFIYVDDAIKATQLIMENKRSNNETVNIGRSAEEITMIDLAEKMFEQFNYKPKRIKVEDAPAGSILRRCPDISKLKAITGFTPQISLKEGLEKTFAWYSTHTNGKRA